MKQKCIEKVTLQFKFDRAVEFLFHKVDPQFFCCVYSFDNQVIED